jgi:hypothetical protein
LRVVLLPYLVPWEHRTPVRAPKVLPWLREKALVLAGYELTPRARSGGYYRPPYMVRQHLECTVAWLSGRERFRGSWMPCGSYSDRCEVAQINPPRAIPHILGAMGAETVVG